MAPVFKFITILSLSLLVTAQGAQFITGACTSDAACASGCCAFKSGKCAAPIPAFERGESCGFGDAQPNNNALNASKGSGGAKAEGQGEANVTRPVASVASTAPATPAKTSPAGGDGAARAPGTQFITGACTSDADCAAGCCGFRSGKCAGAVVAQERDGGCGFGDAQPNDNAAKALEGKRMGRRGPVYM